MLRSILFLGESVPPPEVRGGLEQHAGERGDCIHCDEGDDKGDEDEMHNEDEYEGHNLEDRGDQDDDQDDDEDQGQV